MSLRRLLGILPAALLVLAACRSGHDDSSDDPSGSVTKGPVTGATVRLYAVNTTTRALTLQATAVTGAGGAFSIRVSGVGPFLLVATGGTYRDEATGASRSLGAAAPATLDDPRPNALEMFIGSDWTGTPSLRLNPLTTVASRRIAEAAKTDATAYTEAAVRTVNETVARECGIGTLAGPVDPRSVDPLDFADPADAAAIGAAPGSAPALLGALLGGISQAAASAGAEATAYVDALAADFADGDLDGAGPAGAVTLNGNPFPATGGTADLAAAITGYLGDPAHNVSGQDAGDFAGFIAEVGATDVGGDTTAPAAPSLTGTTPASPSSSANPTVQGTAEAGAEVRLFTDAAATGAVGASGTADGSGNFAIALPVAADGTVQILARAVDAAGNVSDASAPLAYTRDAAAPNAPVLTGTTPASPAQSGGPTVQGTAEAGAEVRLFTDAAATGSVIASATADGSGNFSIGIAVASDTTLQIRARTVDTIGNVSAASAPLAYVRDNTAPAAPNLTGTFPASPSPNGNPAVQGTAEAGSEVRLFTDPAGMGSVLASGTADGSGNVSIGISVASDTTTMLRARAVDAAGNVSGLSGMLTYQRDNSAATPAITGTAPASPANDNNPAVQGTAEADNEIRLYTDAAATGAVVASGTADGSGNFSIAVAVADNTTTDFRARAVDAVGNVSSASASATYVEDSLTPIVLSATASGTSGAISIVYTVRQDQSRRVNVIVEYDDDGAGAFTRATQAGSDPGGTAGTDPEGVSGVSASPTGATHVFLWNSTRDLPAADTTTARIRVRAEADGQVGAPFDLTGLTINNAFSLGAATNVGAGTQPFYVATGDLDGDGDLDLAVANYGSNNVSILLGNGSGTYGAATNYGAGTSPISVAAEDLDGDGDLDLAVANYGSNNVSVLLGDGAGGFGAATNFGVGTNAYSVAAGDLDQDGDLDLAVANINSNDVSILLGNGNGTYAPATNYGPGTAPISVAAEDLDGDGDLDLAVANNGSNNVSVLLGDGAGGFGAATNFGVGLSPRSVRAVDLDGDGDLDLVTANYDSGNVSVLLGDGAGGYGAATDFGVGASPIFVAAEDLDGDGDPDLAVANYGSANVSILLGDGDGTFGAATDSAVGVQPFSVAMGDVDGDGDPDLVTANLGSDNVSILLNVTPPRVEPGLRAPGFLAAGQNPETCAVGDLNGDGKPDLATANSGDDTLTVALGLGNGMYGAPASLATGGAPQTVSIGDLNGDGLNDLAVIAYNDAAVYLHIQDPAAPGTFLPSTSIGFGAGPYYGTLADIDLDGRLDIVASDYDNSQVHVLLQDPATPGTFLAPITLDADTGPYGVAAGDLNEDGYPDIAVADYDGGNVLVHFQDPALPNRFPNTIVYLATSAGSPIYPAIGDLNGDGINDLAVADQDHTTPAGAILLFLQDPASSGSFPAETVLNVGNNTYSVAIADLNNDGRNDLVAPNNGSNTVSVLFQDAVASGTFPTVTDLPVGNQPGFAATGDLNGDGRPDVAVTQRTSPGALVTLLADPSVAGAFASSTDLAVVSGPTAQAVADFDRDGRLDIASANRNSNDVTIHIASTTAGEFLPAIVAHSAGTTPIALAAADVDHDGRLDLIAANTDSANISCLLQDASPAAPGTFGTEITSNAGTNPYGVAIGDFDEDGDSDVAVVNAGSSDLSVLLGNNTGAFADAGGSPIALAGAPYHVGAADLDRDGHLDLAAASNDGNVYVLLGVGDGTFGIATAYAAGSQPSGVAISDLDRDGYPDIVVGNYDDAASTVSVLIQNSAAPGTFNAPQALPAGKGVYFVAAGDLNGDGLPDIAFVNRDYDSAGVLIQSGGGSFEGPYFFAVQDAPMFVLIRDLDRDGIADVVVSDQGSNLIHVLRGR